MEVAVRKGLTDALQQDRAAQAQAQAATQRDIGPIPDDPFRAQRAELEEKSKQFGKEAIKQKERGNLHDPVTGFFAQRQRQAQYEDALAKLPPKPEQQFAEDAIDQIDFNSISQLWNKELADDPSWLSPRMQNDAGVVLARANSRNRNGIIALPSELSPCGNVAPIHPRNMLQIQLPAAQFENFKSMVYGCGGDDHPQEVFRRSWKALRRLGFANNAIPAHEGKPRKKADEPEADPEKMTFKEFCKWREGQEPKRSGFVFPKPVRRND